MEYLTEKAVLSRLSTKWAGRNCQVLQVTDSTNIQCRRLAEEGQPEGTLVLAESQKAGKGRRGRTWVSPPGAGIWMSILLRPDCPADKASMLTLVAALAVERGIRKAEGLATKIKWPNDLVLNGKKICGILTEMKTAGSRAGYVVVGIGINANLTEFSEDLKDKATSLLLESGKEANRPEIVAAVMEAMEEYYEAFLQEQNLSAMVEEYNQKLVSLNRRVRVLDPAGGYEGQCLGITSTGELRVKKDDRSVVSVVSGEVSVRGVYGYV